jgi:hypothetical protein
MARFQSERKQGWDIIPLSISPSDALHATSGRGGAASRNVFLGTSTPTKAVHFLITSHPLRRPLALALFLPNSHIETVPPLLHTPYGPQPPTDQIVGWQAG